LCINIEIMLTGKCDSPFEYTAKSQHYLLYFS